jgi:HSP20 family molecular chaperone IbpA
MNENQELHTAEPTRARRTYAPRADIVENDERVTLVADMPGVAPEDLSVTLENNILKIVGRVEEPSHEGYTLRYSEFEPGDYERSFTLSTRVDPDQISATLRNGQLLLTVPKTQPSSKEIPVSVG